MALTTSHISLLAANLVDELHPRFDVDVDIRGTRDGARVKIVAMGIGTLFDKPVVRVLMTLQDGIITVWGQAHGMQLSRTVENQAEIDELFHIVSRGRG